MSYTTRCTCDAHQLAHVGCDCAELGPVRVVLSPEEERAELIEAEKRAAWQRRKDEEEGIADWYEAELRAWFGDDFIDAPEDFHDYTLRAEAHQ